MSVRVEPNLKKEVKKLCKNLGISTSLVVNTYLKKFIEDKQITIGYDDTDPRFYKWDDFVDVNAPAKEVLSYLKSLKKK